MVLAISMYVLSTPELHDGTKFSVAQNFPKARERLEDLRRGGAKMQKTRVSRSKMNKQSEGECSVM